MQKAGRQANPDKVRETIIQNAQKGQLYRVKIANDPEVYEGMPIASPGMTSDDDNVFEMRISGPSREGEVLRRSIRDVIWMEEV